MAYQNTHLSFSRLSRFEQCPLAFKLHYIDKLQSEPGPPLEFGKAVHAVLERLVREVVDDEQTRPLEEARAFELFREAWKATNLTGTPLFEEGLRILSEFIREQGVLDHRAVLAVEKEFRLPVGPFTVLGFIDRVDWVDDETVEIIDYKTNHQLFTREDVDSSLQLSLYQLAATRLWPWVKRVQLTYWMVRHGVKQRTTRTPEQLTAALEYVRTLGEQTEQCADYPARLNTNCCYCDHRSHCPEYETALRGDRPELSADPDDLEAVARERQRLAHLVKVLSGRKDELDRVLKTHLQQQEELVLAGTRFRMFATTSTEHPVDSTVALLRDATGRPENELRAELTCIDNKAVDALLKKLGKQLEKPRLMVLKAELDAKATKRVSPRLWAKEVA